VGRLICSILDSVSASACAPRHLKSESRRARGPPILIRLKVVFLGRAGTKHTGFPLWVVPIGNCTTWLPPSKRKISRRRKGLPYCAQYTIHGRQKPNGDSRVCVCVRGGWRVLVRSFLTCTQSIQDKKKVTKNVLPNRPKFFPGSETHPNSQKNTFQFEGGRDGEA